MAPTICGLLLVCSACNPYTITRHGNSIIVTRRDTNPGDGSSTPFVAPVCSGSLYAEGDKEDRVSIYKALSKLSSVAPGGNDEKQEDGGSASRYRKYILDSLKSISNALGELKKELGSSNATALVEKLKNLKKKAVKASESLDDLRGQLGKLRVYRNSRKTKEEIGEEIKSIAKSIRGVTNKITELVSRIGNDRNASLRSIRKRIGVVEKSLDLARKHLGESELGKGFASHPPALIAMKAYMSDRFQRIAMRRLCELYVAALARNKTLSNDVLSTFRLIMRTRQQYLVRRMVHALEQYLGDGQSRFMRDCADNGGDAGVCTAAARNLLRMLLHQFELGLGKGIRIEAPARPRGQSSGK
jgi:hypothetical protein